MISSPRGNRYGAFHVRFRGFDRHEVIAALAKLASENEEARREVARLGAELDRLQASVGELRDNERHAQRALVSAHKVADEIRERAEQEARRIVGEADEIREHAEQQARRIEREAEERGELVVQQARERGRQLTNQIDALISRRQEAESTLESFLKLVTDAFEKARQQHRAEDTPFRDTLAPAS